MATLASKRGRVSQATKREVKAPKGLGLIAVLASIQGLVSLGVFARIITWGENGAGSSLPDTSLASLFMNTDLFKNSLGLVTVGDVSLWVERALLVGICLVVTWFAWRMRSQR